MSDQPHTLSTEAFISEAIDIIAIGYPIDGSDEEKASFMLNLHCLIEERAPVVRAQVEAAQRPN